MSIMVNKWRKLDIKKETSKVTAPFRTSKETMIYSFVSHHSSSTLILEGSSPSEV